MSAHVTARLAAQLESAAEDEQIEALLVVREPFPMPDDGGRSQQVVACAAARSGITPVATRYFPRANAALLTAPRSFWAEIIKNEEVLSVEVVTVEGFAEGIRLLQPSPKG